MAGGEHLKAFALGAARMVLATLVAVAVALLGALLLPFLVGFRTSVVVTGSMEPHIHVGDAVVGHRVRPGTVHVGDIVIFSDPGGSGRQLTHRVIAVRRTGRGVAFTTKGDANSSVERFTIRSRGHVGLLSYRIPKVGYLLVRLRGPFARVGLVGLPALVLMATEMIRIWRPKEPSGAHAAA